MSNIKHNDIDNSEKAMNQCGLMKGDEYERMFRFESDYWWYKALHRLVINLVNRETSSQDRSKISIIDCGCGTGGLLTQLKDFYPRLTGFDISKQAIEFSGKRGLENLHTASITDFDLGRECFDIAISLDVLCNVDEEGFRDALKCIHNSLKPKGAFIFNLPAFNSMKSEHDNAVGVYRRFRKSKLRSELTSSGFEIVLLNYRIISLFPLIWLARTIKNIKPKQKVDANSDLKMLPRPLNSLLTWYTNIENSLATRIPAPFGLSVFGVARKLSDLSPD